MCYFEDAADRGQSNPSPLRLATVSLRPANSGMSVPSRRRVESCTRFSDTFVVLVAYCCSACSSIRSASCPIFLRLLTWPKANEWGGVRTSTTVLVN
jgi:hypothetical protein